MFSLGGHTPGTAKFPNISLSLCVTPTHVVVTRVVHVLLSVLPERYNCQRTLYINVRDYLISRKILKTDNTWQPTTKH